VGGPTGGGRRRAVGSPRNPARTISASGNKSDTAAVGPGPRVSWPAMTKGMVLLLACILSATVIAVALVLDDGDGRSGPSVTHCVAPDC
jgi:hypothetical protein